jgi:hypothetical protein
VPVVTEPLTVQVGCWTSPAAQAEGVQHPVTVHPDGSLTTPHDLPAERLAAAFGGYLSCLELVDRVLPALDGWWLLQRRQVLPPMSRGTHGSWQVLPAAAGPCCRPAATAAEVAEHLRSTGHLTRAAGLPERLVRPLARALRTANGTPDLPPDAALDALGCVRGVDGVAALWQAGVHPAVVRTVHDRLVGPDGAELPQALYLGALSHRPDLAWVAETLQRVAEAAGGRLPAEQEDDLAEWLTWTQTRLSRRERERRGAWLTVGVPRGWVVDLARAGYTPDDARRLANGTGRSVPGAAELLRSWFAAGFTPAPDDLVTLHAAGLPIWTRPSRAAVDRVLALAARPAREPDLTAAALALVRAGTVPAAARALRSVPPPTTDEQECA